MFNISESIVQIAVSRRQISVTVGVCSIITSRRAFPPDAGITRRLAVAFQSRARIRCCLEQGFGPDSLLSVTTRLARDRWAISFLNFVHGERTQVIVPKLVLVNPSGEGEAGADLINPRNRRILWITPPQDQQSQWNR